MLEIAVTIFALLLLGGIVVMLIQEPDLLASGMALTLGIVFFSVPLLVSLAPLFVVFLLTLSAVSIGYGVNTIGRRRRAQEIERAALIDSRRRRPERGAAAPAESDWYDEIETQPQGGSSAGSSSLASARDQDYEFGTGVDEFGRPRRDLRPETVGRVTSGSEVARMARMYRRVNGGGGGGGSGDHGSAGAGYARSGGDGDGWYTDRAGREQYREQYREPARDQYREPARESYRERDRSHERASSGRDRAYDELDYELMDLDLRARRRRAAQEAQAQAQPVSAPVEIERAPASAPSVARSEEDFDLPPPPRRPAPESVRSERVRPERVSAERVSADGFGADFAYQGSYAGAPPQAGRIGSLSRLARRL